MSVGLIIAWALVIGIGALWANCEGCKWRAARREDGA